MKRRLLTVVAAAGIVILLGAWTASAQWLDIRLQETPRTPDGKPNLSAPVRKTADGKPDLSGVWRAADGKYLANIAADEGEAPFQPWAESL